jgi:hypothetical protein
MARDDNWRLGPRRRNVRNYSHHQRSAGLKSGHRLRLRRLDKSFRGLFALWVVRRARAKRQLAEGKAPQGERLTAALRLMWLSKANDAAPDADGGSLC